MSISSILTSRGLLNASRANQAPVDVLTLTVAEAQRLLHERHITGVELISKYLEQIRNHNHAGLKLNAVIATPPTDAVLQRARELDEERLAGKVRGPFHGIPILLKDTYSTPTLGMPTTCGSFALAQGRAKSNAKIVDVLLAAGMVVIGKANMSELGNMKGAALMAGWSAFGGQTQSPYVEGGVDPNDKWLGHSGPAGSSSGSAAGVAAGFAPISLGTESDGSIMMPAARAGLYALKITRGTVNDTGVQPALRHFDCLGGFTRNAVDQAHLVAIMQERSPDTYLPLKKSWEGLKIGFVDPTKWRSYPAAMESIESYFQQTDAAMFAAADKIRSEGGKVVHSIPMPSWDEITGAMPSMNDMEDLNPYQFKNCFDDFLAGFEDTPQTIAELIQFNLRHADKEFTDYVSPDANQWFLEAARDDQTTKEEFDSNLNALRSFTSNRVKQLLDEFDVDVILGPSDSRTASVSSASGFPVGNLPLGFADFNGRGFSLHMVAPENSEATMLQVMAAWEATFPENVRPPPSLTKM